MSGHCQEKSQTVPTLSLFFNLYFHYNSYFLLMYLSIELLIFCKVGLQKWYKNVVYIKIKMVIIPIIKGG